MLGMVCVCVCVCVFVCMCACVCVYSMQSKDPHQLVIWGTVLVCKWTKSLRDSGSRRTWSPKNSHWPWNQKWVGYVQGIFIYLDLRLASVDLLESVEVVKLFQLWPVQQENPKGKEEKQRAEEVSKTHWFIICI